MKRQFFYGLLLLLNFSLISSTCSSDDDGNSNNNSAEIQQITNDIQSGTWVVTSFIDSGQNETSYFSGYDFTFDSNGTLTADNGSDTVTGIWSITDSSSTSSNSDNDIDFNIQFSVPDTSVFDEINDDWGIVSNTSTKIELLDDSSSGTETLTFEKNQ